MEIEGVFDGRSIRIFWQPGKKSSKSLLALLIGVEEAKRDCAILDRMIFW